MILIIDLNRSHTFKDIISIYTTHIYTEKYV